MVVLYTAFAGTRNSSKLLLDEIKREPKITLTNSFQSSEKQIIEAICMLQPDYIISFGQKPKCNCLYVETQARGSKLLGTKFPLELITNTLTKRQIRFQLSDNAGNYLCNHVYYQALRYIETNNLHTKMVFIHIPVIKNFIEFEKAIKWLNELDFLKIREKSKK